ncbi:MAG TPA: phasin family protein [Azospirillaceae bacterium]|nr:phasin family protein [Azospirillaceae bacterium]
MTTVRTTAKTTAPKTADQVATDAKQTLEANVQAAQEVAAKTVDQAVALTKEQVEKVSKQAFQTYDELTAFNKGTVEAVVASSQILAKGFETVSKTWVAFAQSSMEQSVSAAKALMTVKTLREAMDLQAEFARTSFDTLVAETTKVSELSVKVANEAIEPISARVNAAVEKFGKAKLAA